MNMSSVPVISALLLAFLPFCALMAARKKPGQAPGLLPLIILIAGLAAWAFISSWASISNYYDRPEFLATFPGLWLPLVPVVIAVTFYLLSPALRESLRRTLNGSPTQWHVLFQALRLVSLGAIYKAYQGVFPTYFAIYSGGFDFLFACSAIWMTVRVKSGKATRMNLIVWNIIGFATLALTAPLLLQLGLPGPLQIYTDAPLSDVILEFPMALAPTLTGPLFITMNALWIKHLIFDVQTNADAS